MTGTEYKMPLPWHEMLFNFDVRINRAVYRLREIADGERILGYQESADMYEETANEISAARIWVQNVIRKMLRDEQE